MKQARRSRATRWRRLPWRRRLVQGALPTENQRMWPASRRCSLSPSSLQQASATASVNSRAEGGTLFDTESHFGRSQRPRCRARPANAGSTPRGSAPPRGGQPPATRGCRHRAAGGGLLGHRRGERDMADMAVREQVDHNHSGKEAYYEQARRTTAQGTATPPRSLRSSPRSRPSRVAAAVAAQRWPADGEGILHDEADSRGRADGDGRSQAHQPLQPARQQRPAAWRAAGVACAGRKEPLGRRAAAAVRHGRRRSPPSTDRASPSLSTRRSAAQPRRPRIVLRRPQRTRPLLSGHRRRGIICARLPRRTFTAATSAVSSSDTPATSPRATTTWAPATMATQTSHRSRTGGHPRSVTTRHAP